MFENILGNKEAKEYLTNSFNNDNISHSYLFLGNDGIGKKLVSLEYAKKILKVDNLETCVDFKLVTKKADKKNITVEQIREEILKDIYTAPLSGDKKVYVIDGFEKLNISGQNALLKTLEEPPEYIVIILISSNLSNILPTIISRVNIIKFVKLSSNEMKEYIYSNSLNIKDNMIEFLDGSIGRLNSFLDLDIIDKLENIDKLYNYIYNENYTECITLLNEIDFNNEYIFSYYMYIMHINNKNLCVTIAQRAYNNLKNNGNYDIVIDNMIIKSIDNIKYN